MWMTMGSASVGRGGKCTDMTVNTLYLQGGGTGGGRVSSQRRCSAPSEHARGKQELLLAVHIAAAHQVDVLASLHHVVLAGGIQVNDPVNGRFPRVKLAVPEK